MNIGIQVSSLKPLLLTEEQVRQAFCKMKALGCNVVQLQWIVLLFPSTALHRHFVTTALILSLFRISMNRSSKILNTIPS